MLIFEANLDKIPFNGNVEYLCVCITCDGCDRNLESYVESYLYHNFATFIPDKISEKMFQKKYKQALHFDSQVDLCTNLKIDEKANLPGTK